MYFSKINKYYEFMDKIIEQFSLYSLRLNFEEILEFPETTEHNVSN